MTMHRIRAATMEDVAALNELITLSARALSRDYYTPEETESAIRYVFGVDSELIEDESYFVIEEACQFLACGGWSRRRTLFGGDRYEDRETGFLDPKHDAAKIRAFFVHPEHARKGLGAALIAHCEAEAKRHGFTRMELMSTLPGLPLYQKAGYRQTEPRQYTMPDGTHVDFVAMHKIFA